MSTDQELDQEPRLAGLAEVLRMAAPIIAGTLSYTVMHFVDAVMVSRISDEAFAAVGSSGVWVFTLATFFLGVVGCVSTFAAQSFGRGEKADCARYTWQGVYVSLATGLLAIGFWPISESLFRIMQHGPEVARLEVIYFKVRLLGFAFLAWQAALAGFFQAVNRPVIPMTVAVVANLVNGILDYALIFGKFGFPRWGIAGAAAATVIAQMVQVGLLQAVFLSGAFHASFETRSAGAVSFTKIRELLRIGWPNGLTFLMDILNWAVFTSFIVGYFGTVQLAAHNAATAFIHLSFMPAVGLNHAVAPIVGQWIGRGRILTAKARTYTALKLAIGYMVTVGLILALLGPYLIRWCFTDNPEIVRLGRILLILAAVFQGFDATNIVTMGALRGAGDTRFMMWAFFAAGYLLFLPVAFMLAFALGWGAVGAWIGATVYIIALSGVLLHRFHFEAWRHIRIFERDRVPA